MVKANRLTERKNPDVEQADTPFLTMDLAILDNLKGYSNTFMDPVLWSPYVRRVCQEHKISPVESIRPGLTGTYPTFIVNEHRVVKFFGRLFDGEMSYTVERLCARLVQTYRPFPTAELLAWGELLPGESRTWPYLIFEYIPGISIGEKLAYISHGERQRLAGWLGEAVHALHAIPLDDEISGILPKQDPIVVKNRQRGSKRHQEWPKFPQSWIPKIDDFLTFTDSLTAAPWPLHLIHADLTRDHLLGHLQNGCWTTKAVIDFGDALVGSLDYELVVLHLDVFQGDTRLLKIFLNCYGLDKSEYALFPYRAMRAALLHQFNLFEPYAGSILSEAEPDLEAIALSLWNPSK